MASTDYAPAGVRSNVVIKTPDELSPEIRELVFSLKRALQARTVDDHRIALKSFDEDLQWDGPFAIIHGKDRVRLLATLVKFFVDTDLDPNVVRIRMADDKSAILDVDGVLKLRPKKTIFLPPTYLLPNEIPLDVSTEMGVKSTTDKISYMKGRMHNLPNLPYFVRYLAGFTLGSTAVVMESVYYQLMDWYHTGSPKLRSATEQVASMAPVQTITQATSNLTSNIGETATGLMNSAKEMLSVGGTNTPSYGSDATAAVPKRSA